MVSRKTRIKLLRLLAVPIFLIPVFVYRSWDDESLADFVAEWAGYAFLIVGLGMRMWATLYIGARKSKELVTSGPYSICRNPLYLGTGAIVIGAGLCFENVPVLIASLVVMLPVHWWVARAEEDHLEEIFGEEYRRYRNSVPGFWPNVRKYSSPETLTVSVRAIRRVTVETAGVLLIPLLGDLIEQLNKAGLLPIIWRWP